MLRALFTKAERLDRVFSERLQRGFVTGRIYNRFSRAWFFVHPFTMVCYLFLLFLLGMPFFVWFLVDSVTVENIAFGYGVFFTVIASIFLFFAFLRVVARRVLRKHRIRQYRRKNPMRSATAMDLIRKLNKK